MMDMIIVAIAMSSLFMILSLGMSHKVKNNGIVSKNVHNYFKNHFTGRAVCRIGKSIEIIGMRRMDSGNIFAVEIAKQRSDMKTLGLLIPVYLLFASFASVSCDEAEVRCSIIPAPMNMDLDDRIFCFDERAVFSVENPGQKDVAEWFVSVFEDLSGFAPSVCFNGADADVMFHEVGGLGRDGYRIYAEPKMLTIEASEEAGFFYAMQTLRFMLSHSEKSGTGRHASGWHIPVMKVADRPYFSHRCLRLDVRKSFLPVEDILEFLDYMAMLKFNFLHLNTDDMAEMGYSPEDIRKVCDCAAALYIEIVPVCDGKNVLYSCQGGAASKVFPDIAALAEVAWTNESLDDVIRFNKAMDVLNENFVSRQIYRSGAVCNVSLACLK